MAIRSVNKPRRNALLASVLSVWTVGVPAAAVDLAGEYRRAITLDPPTARPNSVVLIVLNTRALGRPYGHIRSDGSDIRLTGSDGKTLLPYWIEHGDPCGDSRIWVRFPQQGSDRLWLHYGKAGTRAASDGAAVFDLFDDFNDGLWTKYAGNPVLINTEPWESRAICAPSVIVEDGRWRMWYMGCKTSTGTNAALGYATSPDGFSWTKHPGNPILRDPGQAVIRTTVLPHCGNRLSIDGRPIGICRASAPLCNRSDWGVGFSSFGTFAAWDDVRVERAGLGKPAVRIGEEEPGAR